MKKCFPCFFCYNEKKIDEPVETKKIVPNVVREPAVKRPINIQKASKPVNDGAGSSNQTVPKKKGYLEQAQDAGAGVAAAAGQAKVMVAAAAQQGKGIAVGAAGQVRAFGNGAFNLLPNGIQGYFGKEIPRNDHNRVVIGRQHDLGEKERKQKQIRHGNRRKPASENNSGETSMVGGFTDTLRSAMSKYLTDASTQAPGTGTGTGTAQSSTSRTRVPSHPFSTQNETRRPVKKKGKKPVEKKEKKKDR